jgi:RNA 3'-terminal phosphate cyclase
VGLCQPFADADERVAAGSDDAGPMEDALVIDGSYGEGGGQIVRTGLARHHASGAALDRHLADQVLLPLAVAGGPSQFSAEVASRHLATNVWVIEQFGLARVEVHTAASGVAEVTVTPTAAR